MDAALATPSLPDSWEVEQARLSLFVTGRPTNPTELWTATRNSEPLNEATERGGPFPVYRATGPFDDSQLTLQVEPNRIDWLLTDNPNIETLPAYFAAGAYQVITRSFIDFGKTFLQNNELPVVRMALGFVLLKLVPNRDAGYSFLDPLLPFDLDPASRDLFYRINRPKRSPNTDILINRLNDWSVLELTPSAYIAAPGVAQLVQQPPIYLARLA